MAQWLKPEPHEMSAVCGDLPTFESQKTEQPGKMATAIQ